MVVVVSVVVGAAAVEEKRAAAEDVDVIIVDETVVEDAEVNVEEEEAVDGKDAVGVPGGDFLYLHERNSGVLVAGWNAVEYMEDGEWSREKQVREVKERDTILWSSKCLCLTII